MTRIAIPSDDRSTVSPHFGRTSGFLVFTWNGAELSSDYRAIAATPRESCCGSEGESRHESILNAIRDCDVVIAGGMGGGMLAALYEAGIEVAMSSVLNARDAAEMLIADVLPASSGSGCCIAEAGGQTT
jgi:predicted Fe-Mo cluster-binding NifX family protein